MVNAGLCHPFELARCWISPVEQLPTVSQMTLGGAPYRDERPLKSPSFDTMVKPCCRAYAQTAESSAVAKPTART